MDKYLFICNLRLYFGTFSSDQYNLLTGSVDRLILMVEAVIRAFCILPLSIQIRQAPSPLESVRAARLTCC